jgi:hypothetical protein
MEGLKAFVLIPPGLASPPRKQSDIAKNAAGTSASGKVYSSVDERTVSVMKVLHPKRDDSRQLVEYEREVVILGSVGGVYILPLLGCRRFDEERRNVPRLESALLFLALHRGCHSSPESKSNYCRPQNMTANDRNPRGTRDPEHKSLVRQIFEHVIHQSAIPRRPGPDPDPVFESTHPVAEI